METPLLPGGVQNPRDIYHTLHIQQCYHKCPHPVTRLQTLGNGIHPPRELSTDSLSVCPGVTFSICEWLQSSSGSCRPLPAGRLGWICCSSPARVPDAS